MRLLLEYLEIVLSVAGLLVIVLATWLLTPMFGDPWPVAAFTATAVGVLHGGIFWAVRRRQRLVRRVALRDVQSMLQDVINNQLAVIRGVNEINRDVKLDSAVAMIDESVEQIAATLRGLSEESLATWKSRYPGR